jgi:hypothetical protein
MAMNMRDLISICEAEDLKALMASIRERNNAAEVMLRDALSNSSRLALVHPEGKKILVSKSLDPDYKWRLTYFDDAGPSGHVEYRDITREMSNEIAMALKNGYVRS